MRFPFRFLLLTASLVTFSSTSPAAQVRDTYQPDRWKVAINGGVAPTFYEDVGRTFSFSTTIPGLVVSARAARFDQQYHTPYVIDAELGYVLACDIEVFLAFDYNHGSGNKFNFILGSAHVLDDFTPYSFNSYAGYIGTRYFFSLFSSNVFIPFVGFKVGYMHRNQANTDGYINGFFLPANPVAILLTDDTVSGGVHLGFDYNFTNNIAIDFKVEALAAGARRNKRVSLNVPPLNAVTGQTGAVLSIPITLGLVYTI